MIKTKTVYTLTIALLELTGIHSGLYIGENKEDEEDFIKLANVISRV